MSADELYSSDITSEKDNMSESATLLTSDAHDGVTPEQYSWTPLHDPSNQFRLLKHMSKTDAGPPSFELTTWATADPPHYSAISYAWGNVEHSAIRVDGLLLNVRSNCVKALHEAVEFDNKVYLWIDSVCVNQDDAREKSAQVQKMFDIYKNAGKVPAYVGDHADDSELLLDMCRRVEGVDKERLWGLTGLSVQETSQELAKRNIDLDHDTLVQTKEALLAFSKRPYWSRLWVVQEACVGADALALLCGHDSVVWESLCKVADLIQGMNMGTPLDLWEDPFYAFQKIMEIYHASPGGIRLSDWTSWIRRLCCTDVGDMIYGAFHLIDWEVDKIDPILPDYERTAWAVAQLVIAVSEPMWASDIMKIMRIDASTPEMQSLVASRGEDTLIPAPECRLTNFLR